MRTLVQFLPRLLAGVAIFLAVEGAVFRTGFYTRYLEPDSTAGYLQSILYNESVRPLDGPNQVLAIGHSRMGFRPRAANNCEAAAGYRFATIATAGTSPRCWYYMLRDVDPTASRYAAIVIGVDDYDDEDYEDLSSREMDLRYLAPLLQWRDVLEFPLSFSDWPLRFKAFSTAVCKGYALRADFQDLLANHKARMRRIQWERRESAAFQYNLVWGSQSMAGLSVDWSAGSIVYPPGLTAEKREETRNVLLRETVQQTGKRGAYLRKWYGRVLDLYRGSRTRIVFLRLPRGPVVRPVRFVPKSATVRELARRNPRVLLLPEYLFDSLERGEYFGDAMHLNESGSVLFSRLAAAEIVSMLQPGGAR